MLSTDHTESRRSYSYDGLGQPSGVASVTVQQTPFSAQTESYIHYNSQDQYAGRKRAISETDTPDPNDSSAVRRRISRACDQCNQLRSRCDGRHPCAHCVESQLPCKYERAHKKRGRIPKKEQTQPEGKAFVANQVRVEGDVSAHEAVHRDSVDNSIRASQDVLSGAETSNGTSYVSQTQPDYYNEYGTLQNPGIGSSNPTMDLARNFTAPNVMNFAVDNSATYATGPIDLSGYGFPFGDDYSVAFMGRAPMVESPDWLALTSSNFVGEQWATPSRPPDALRFPVLQSILPHVECIIPAALACDLLEQYFATTMSTNYQPKNPYVLSYVFRKQSVLHPTNPRPCTAALLASMLWIAAQHSDSPFLTSQPDARARICQKLLELTINMLKPLVHSYGNTSSNHAGSQNMARVDTSLGGLVLPIDIIAGSEVNRKQVDNIVTYIHLATVVSASERKSASLRWWNAAWSLAREIRLGRELPYEDPLDRELPIQQTSSTEVGRKPTQHHRAASLTSNSTHTETRLASNTMTEEDREERRRTWWLLYMMDRHLALCYNRPMFFLNKECETLLQPLDEAQFQTGHFDSEPVEQRRKGLDIECTSFSVYGFFLPLMVILGEILDLNHARYRPRFGPGAKRPKDYSDTIDEIGEQLEAFAQSLSDVEERHHPSVGSTATTGFVAGKRAGHDLQTGTGVAYGTHIMHVLHILLTGKWDPIAMLDDNDLWISSQSFVNATGHAVSAAEALADVIDYDPDLSFMPYFFGIYLLQGSFLLLLFADKLQDNITTEVVRACETIVRAHEACVSTLDNQYQRNFRRVMRSALQQLRGRLHEDATEQQHWRREILKLYRWTGDGTGLAL